MINENIEPVTKNPTREDLLNLVAGMKEMAYSFDLKTKQSRQLRGAYVNCANMLENLLFEDDENS